MKTLKNYSDTIILTVFFVAAVFLLGCNSTQQSTAYKTIYGIEKSVSAANSAYLDLVIQGKVGTNDVPKLTKAFNQFQADVTLALDAVQYNTNALAPSSLVIESQDLLTVIESSKQLWTVKGVK